MIKMAKKWKSVHMWKLKKDKNEKKKTEKMIEMVY